MNTGNSNHVAHSSPEEGLRKTMSTANGALNQLVQQVGLEENVQAHPYRLLAGAVGVGYVLGGGFFTPLTFRLLSFGAKLLTVPLVQNRLLDMAETAVNRLMTDTTANP